MKRSRFTEEQIMGILKEHEAGVSVADLCNVFFLAPNAPWYKCELRRFARDPSVT